MDYHNALNEQIEIHRQQQDGSIRTGRSGVDDAKLPWQRSAGPDRLRQEHYGHELYTMVKEKEDEKTRESSERLMEEQKVSTINSGRQMEKKEGLMDRVAD